MPAIPLPTTTSRSGGAMLTFIALHPCAAERDRVGPSGAPMFLEEGNGGQRRKRQTCEDQERRLICPAKLLRIAKARSEIEAANAAGHSDETGHNAYVTPETLGHELEDGAIPHAERAKGEKKYREPRFG